MLRLSLALCLVVCVAAQVGAGAWKGFRIAQESKNGAADFDKNILGFVQPVDASKVTVAQYYGYGSASFVGAGTKASAVRPTPKTNYVIMFLAWNKMGAGKGLNFYTVYDVLLSKTNKAQPGNLFAHFQAYGSAAAIKAVKAQFVDDPGEFKKDGYPKKAVAKDHARISFHNAWAPCCTDGNVWGPLQGITKIFATLSRGSTQKTPSRWQFETWGKGARVPLVMAPGTNKATSRKIRLDNHVCDPKVDCNGRGVCDANSGKCKCQTGYLPPSCNKCAPNYKFSRLKGFPKLLCSPTFCRGTPTLQANQPTGTKFATTCANTKNRGTCALSCPTGYQPTGPATCANGKWDTTNAKCHKPKPDDCKSQPKYANDVAGDYVKCDDVESGNYCKLDCKAGYDLQPANSKGILCTNGKYDPTTAPKCVANGCDPFPSKAPGTWSAPCGTANDVPSGKTCTLKCNTGYDLKAGTKPATCLNGKWTNIPVCHKVCPNPPPNPQPAGTFPASCANTHDGQICTLSCPTGYTKLNDAKCVDGDWNTDDAECLHDLDCHEAPAPLKMPPPTPAATWNCQNVGTGGRFLVKLGSTCSIVCPKGYDPSAPSKCLNGKWTDANCVKSTPPMPEMLCRCIKAGFGDKQGHLQCGVLPMTDTMTTFITHVGFDPTEEFGPKPKWAYNPPWLTATGTGGGSWKCGPWDGALGWKTN